MLRLSAFIFSLLVISLLHAPGLSAASLTIAFSYDIPPFIMENGTRGLEIDIVREALKRSGHTFTTVQCSYRRLQIAVLQMNVDAAAAVRELKDGTYYSDNFIAFKNYAISKKRSGFTIESIPDLKGKTIYTWQNAYRDLGDEFKSIFSPNATLPPGTNYYEIPVQKKQVELFWMGRGDSVIIIDEAIFKWFTKQMAETINPAEEVVYHNIFDATTEYQISFKDRQIRDDFNRGLEQIRRSGLLKKLTDAYR